VTTFLASQQGEAFTYAEVSGTLGDEPPPGYAVDRNRIKLGEGAATFERAVTGLRSWRMLRHDWASVSPIDASQSPGTTVAVVARHYGFWSLNACRIVYALDDPAESSSRIRRIGFAYGTLPEHGAVGEERFSVEWHAADDTVWFDLYAFSRPSNLLARLGYPFARRLQRRFALAAKRAMLAAVALGA
jgi:uncharacterized protein (UPF0548 family)